jgi:hypothetical protein
MGTLGKVAFVRVEIKFLLMFAANSTLGIELVILQSRVESPHSTTDDKRVKQPSNYVDEQTYFVNSGSSSRIIIYSTVPLKTWTDLNFKRN